MRIGLERSVPHTAWTTDPGPFKDSIVFARQRSVLEGMDGKALP
jgi:hypothetical protein